MAMAHLRSVASATAVILVATLGLAGCSSSATGEASSPASSGAAGGSEGDGSEGDGSATAQPYRVSRAALASAPQPASADVGPARGATLTVTLPSGAVATLVVEAGSVDARTTLRMEGFTVDGVEGVQLEPAGTWLNVPAHLAFTSTTKTPAIRLGSADGSWVFGAPAMADDGSVIVVRLRPVVLLDDGPAPLPTALPGPEGGTPPVIPEDDPLDEKAAEEEQDEAAEPDGESGSQDAKDEARSIVTQLAGECGDGVPEASARALEAWRTAGSVGAPPVDCAVLTASVLAEISATFRGAPVAPYQEVVHASGSGPSVDKVADILMPAEREVTGIEQMLSYVSTGIAGGLLVLAGRAPEMPRVGTCTLGSIPQGTVRLETDPLPDGKLRVTLTPKHGAYPVTCTRWPKFDMDVTVWDFVRDILGTGGGQKIVLTVPATERVQHVLSSVKSVEGSRVRHTADGGITVTEEGGTVHGVLDLDLSFKPAT